MCACAKFNVCLPLHGLRTRNITNVFLHQLLRKRTNRNFGACVERRRDYFCNRAAKTEYYLDEKI